MTAPPPGSLLPLGSIVILNNGTSTMMVVGRIPLYSDPSGASGYFDYVATLYPTGIVDGTLAYFNEEDISHVLFRGYADDMEDAFQRTYSQSLESGGIPYRRLSVTDISAS